MHIQLQKSFTHHFTALKASRYPFLECRPRIVVGLSSTRVVRAAANIVRAAAKKDQHALYTPPAPYDAPQDNEDSLLDQTHLVFINPVGTAYSTAIAPEKIATFGASMKMPVRSGSL
jgi:hypothetical protein